MKKTLFSMMAGMLAVVLLPTFSPAKPKTTHLGLNSTKGFLFRAFAADGTAGPSDNYYTLSETTYSWDGVDAAEYSGFGDEDYFSYDLPWPFYFCGTTYNQINIDSNGNIWFGYEVSLSSERFNLS